MCHVYTEAFGLKGGEPEVGVGIHSGGVGVVVVAEIVMVVVLMTSNEVYAVGELEPCHVWGGCRKTLMPRTFELEGAESQIGVGGGEAAHLVGFGAVGVVVTVTSTES